MFSLATIFCVFVLLYRFPDILSTTRRDPRILMHQQLIYVVLRGKAHENTFAQTCLLLNFKQDATVFQSNRLWN